MVLNTIYHGLSERVTSGVQGVAYNQFSQHFEKMKIDQLKNIQTRFQTF